MQETINKQNKIGTSEKEFPTKEITESGGSANNRKITPETFSPQGTIQPMKMKVSGTSTSILSTMVPAGKLLKRALSSQVRRLEEELPINAVEEVKPKSPTAVLSPGKN
jgi:hypothetical protein